jgi:SAM-dependent methyltransferase
MVERFREDFLVYTGMPPEFFRGKVGLDAGCGFGRHLFYAAAMGAEMIGMDFSAAATQALHNVRGLSNADVVQGDIFRPPFRKQTFDFVYSIGVLHHLPDPEQGFRALLPLLKPGGAVLVWVYSKSRRWTNSLLEAVRRCTSRLPFGVLKLLSFLGAVGDWACFIGPYKATAVCGPLRSLVDRVMFPRIKLYARYPFQVAYADWFDRLSAPVRFYYDEADLHGWAERAMLRQVRISPTGKYGFRLYGQVSEDH